MSKYIDLKEMIHAETRDQVYLDEVGEVLDWLDDHPDQVPGRTMTASEFGNYNTEAAGTYGDGFRAGFERAGGEVVPDPEPTNAEKLEIYLGLHDLDAITQDGVADFARQLDADGVKAPGGDDDGR